MKMLFQHIYPAFHARIENMIKKYDFGELRFLFRELKKCVNQFENFNKTGDTFMPLQDIEKMVKLIAEVAKEVREDREERMKQFVQARKKMDEEDIEYFEEDIKKTDKIENFVMEIAGIIIQVYKDSVSDMFK